MALINVFIDSHVFVAENFLQGSSLNALFEKGENGEANLYTSELVIREITRRFKELQEAAFRKLYNVSVLKNVPESKELIEKLNNIDSTKHAHEFEEIFKKQLKMAKVKILPLVPLNVSVVVDQYFNQLPPFGPKKTKEFPDSFNIQIIEENAEKLKKDFIFVTGDPDFNTLNSKRIKVESLQNILSIITSNTNSRPLIKSLTQSVYKESKQIEKLVELKLDDYMMFRFHEYWDFDLESVKIIKFTIKDVLIEHYRRYTVLAYLDVQMDIELVVTYNNLDGAYYDKEDDRYFGGENVRARHLVSVNVPIVCESNAVEDELTDFEIKSINNKKEILIEEGPQVRIIEARKEVLLRW